jgi:mono/diheme cytochrome c family protein
LKSKFCCIAIKLNGANPGSVGLQDLSVRSDVPARRQRLAMIAAGCAAALVCATASAQTSHPQKFSVKQVRAGAAIFERNCSPCHGAHMADPEGAFDLRTFPHDQHSRFVNSVTNGKNSMPAWRGLLKPLEIEALWAYVVTGEKPTAKDSDKK